MKKTMACMVGIAGLLLLGGCATPKVDASKFSAPKTVVIDDIPDIHSVATIEVVVTNWPAMYFNGRFDRFYTVNGVPPSLAAVADNTEQVNQVVTNQIVNSPRPVSVGQAAAMGAVGGLVGGLIQASAEDTQKRAAEFPALMRKTLPGDLRTEVMQALRESLEAKGIQVRVASESRTAPLRLHWPGKDADGKPLPAFSIYVKCESEGQLLGAAEPDLYLLQNELPVTQNFLKGMVGLWCRLCIVVGVAVAVSTYLSGILAFLLTAGRYVIGLFTDHLNDLATSRNIGGPFQSLSQIVKAEQSTVPVSDTAGARALIFGDKIAAWFFRRFQNLIPDVDSFSWDHFVAEGFNVNTEYLVVNLLITFGYLLPWAVLAYYLMNNREVAA